MEENYEAQKRADEALYRYYLEDLSEEEAKKAAPEVYADWIKLRDESKSP